MKALPLLLLPLMLLTHARAADMTCPYEAAAGSGKADAARPDDKKDDDKKEKPPGKPGEPERPRISVSEHTITVNGRQLKYKATAGWLTLSDEKAAAEKDGKPDTAPAPTPEAGKPKARVFFIAYTLEGADPAKRPITYAFNGGPGAASVWLHLGELGPRRVKLGQLEPNPGPPFTLVDNDQTWLAETDLVFIDPVSTGYSRPAPGATATEFHGYQQDVKSVGDFIRLYTTQNNRWLCPKFLVGESYGGIRAAGLCDYLVNEVNLDINGVIVVSGLLNWQCLDFAPRNDVPFFVCLPSYAATAWYYKKDAPEYQRMSLAEVRSQAEEFATNDYLLALGKGDRITPGERDRIADRLNKFTGVPLDFLRRHDLRISSYSFRAELLKADSRAPGRFDSRYSGIVYDPEDDIGDPSFSAIHGAFAATINSYLRTELKFESDLPYQILTSVEPWSFNSDNHYLDVAGALGKTMTQNPRLKAWFLLGAYDLAVPYYSTVYTLDHMHLDPSIKKNISVTTYESGHMIYTDQTCLKTMHDDFAAFIRQTTGEHGPSGQ